MKITELLKSKFVVEPEQKTKFSVEHKNGQHMRAYTMTLDHVNDSVMFSYAEKKKISKLEIGETYTTQRTNIQGRTLVRVTRTS
jgi:hypothetical protein